MWRGVTRGRVTGAVLLAAAALVASAAGANTRSQQLYAKALLPFHAQRWQEAQRLLDQAAAADPDDAVVAYYQGLVQARLGNTQPAIKDLERALSLRPDLQGAVLDLGILYFETAQYQPAQEWLQRAYAQPANRFSAAFFLGLTHLRLGDPKGAQPLFADAAKDPELRPAAQYYEALAQLRQGEGDDARTLFQQAQAGPPDAETTQLARQYLSGPVTTAATTAAEAPWEVHGDAGFGYDSNVVLAPNSSSLKRDYSANPNYPDCPKAGFGNCPTTIGLNTHGEQDGFFRVSAGGTYRLFAVDTGSGVIGYDFYNSAHFTSSAYDVQNHRLQMTLSSRPFYQFVQVGVTGVYDFYLLDYRGYYQQGRGTPWVTLYEGQIGATQGYYSLVGQDFLNGLNPNSPTYSPAQFNNDPFNPFRDAINNAVGIRQYFLLGAADRSMSIGYQFDNNDPLSRDGTDFAYQDNAFDAQVDFRILEWWYGKVGYLFDLQDYDHPNSRTDFSKRRHDAQSQVVVDFRFPLPQTVTPRLSPYLTYLGVFNHSNIPDFEYDRNIVQAGVWLHF